MWGNAVDCRWSSMEAFTRFDRFVSSELGGMMCQEGMHKRGPDIYNACSELRMDAKV